MSSSLKCFVFTISVYASYDDISAEDFLHVQTDTEYRKEWDKSAITLEVIDTDPVHRNKSHIIHWEMQWPVNFICNSIQTIESNFSPFVFLFCS